MTTSTSPRPAERNRFLAWRDRMAADLATWEEVFGEPAEQSGNRLKPPASEEELEELARQRVTVPDSLLELYRLVGGASLLDAGLAFFIWEPKTVLRVMAQEGPVRMRGNHEGDIVPFGQDGGGTYYALASPSGSPVYVLPEASVVDQTYESKQPGFRVLAADLDEFLDRFHHALVVCLRGGDPVEL